MLLKNKNCGFSFCLNWKNQMMFFSQINISILAGIRFSLHAAGVVRSDITFVQL
jgi:hypothetical protein